MEILNFTILRKLVQQLFATLMLFCFFMLPMVAHSTLPPNPGNFNMELFLSTTDETCTNSSDGSVSVVVAGGTPGFTYLWNTGDTTDIVYNLTSGTYTVTVTDSQGEMASNSIEVQLSPEGLWIIMSTTADADCGPNGIAHVSAMTGTPPYIYQWDDPAMQTGEDAFNLLPGTYFVTVTDSNGCTAADSTIVGGTVGITSCSAIVTSSFNEGVDISVFGGNDGSASVNVVGGTAPLTYQWSNNQTTAQITDLTSGSYSVIVTDAEDCTCVSSVTLFDPAKVGDFVWDDLNENGIQNSGEPGFDGIVIHLSGTSNAQVPVNRTTTSNPDGSYIFDGLPAGTYQITFETPAGYAGSPQFAGSNTDLDSNPNPTTGVTNIFSLDISECLFSIDAGFYFCGTSLGDYVFFDYNKNGIQDPIEPGVNNVYVALHSAGPDGTLYTGDDVQEDWTLTSNNGHYLFSCVEPGEYYIRFAPNTEVYKFSPQYQGNDIELDSNADTLTGFTEPIVVFQGMANDLSYDAGMYYLCEDFTYGGTIGQDQFICAGDAPETLHTVIPPSGGSGNPEYLWLKSVAGGSFPNPSWMEIPNSNVENYNPGPLFVTTYFIRCIRREGCPTFSVESTNQVTITVLPNNHEYCTEGIPDPFTSGPSAEIIAESKNVVIKWTTGPEDGLFYYLVERSSNGNNFAEIAMVPGNAHNDSINHYSYIDSSPMLGRNVYRIRQQAMMSNFVNYSNTAEVDFAQSDQQFAAHPNPSQGLFRIEASHAYEQLSTLTLYNSLGQKLESYQIPAGETSVEIDLNSYPDAIYFLHIQAGKNDKSHVLELIKR